MTKEYTYSLCEWQFIGSKWVFGLKIRGIVRESLAEVYWNEKAGTAQWAWTVFTDIRQFGTASTLIEAIETAENALNK